MAIVTTRKTTDTLHPIVEDRMIQGEGTSQDAWQNWDGLQSLPALSIAENFPKHQRVCIFAPHPDDEILGCGGLLQVLAAQGNPLTLISVTNGTQSHPNSAIYPPEQLNIIRPLESQLALATLGIHAKVERMAFELTDGNVYDQQNEFEAKLAEIINEGDILVTTFIHDGHPDHEVTGQVVQRYAQKNGLSCFQVLIWAWHWAQPNDVRIPWARAKRLDLTAHQQQLKTHAIHCFQSQISTDLSTGHAPILTTTTINRITQPWEVYVQ